MRARGIEECLFLLLLLLTSLASSPLHQCASKTCTYHYGNRFGIFLCSSSSFSTHTHTITRMVEAENANSFSSPPSSTEVLCSYSLSLFLQT